MDLSVAAGGILIGSWYMQHSWYMRHYVSATVDGRMAMLLYCHVISDSGVL